MAGLMRVDGVWPEPITLSTGWYRARSRPWNEQVRDPVVRLDRGGADFLLSVVDHLRSLGAEAVYSPALFATTTRVWKKAGFREHTTLEIMERAIGPEAADAEADVTVDVEPDWRPILEVDRAAFEGFWGMSELGLQDAFETNKSSVLLTVGHGAPHGYALVGAQWGTAYLHRIAVHPAETGRGWGRALMASAFEWAYRVGARTMVLNVRSENARAIRVYERAGFAKTPSVLTVFRSDSQRLLN